MDIASVDLPDAGGPAMATMRRWARSGAHRIDHDDSGDYDSAEAVKIMDAWWPLWVRREFKPTLGKQLNETLIGTGHAIHDAPGPIGSAFQNVVYGFVQKVMNACAEVGIYKVEIGAATKMPGS